MYALPAGDGPGSCTFTALTEPAIGLTILQRQGNDLEKPSSRTPTLVICELLNKTSGGIIRIETT